ncbi:hypothetical protein Cgig2_007595 [Carnegiea gigantea]|uniref:Uncharacterized protein n=1 Tax=Carnegiea gigantea TaxID=171969 RepID=A0A9Q1Q6S6_9CARY|nr:hypothetical protein Cgig2_007595 [Carnegiea gigantea]
MGFPRSLTTDEMALYVLGNFEWYSREVTFPPFPLQSDYEELYSDFVLAAAEEYARDSKVPELPLVVFLAMLLNDTVKLGVLRGWMIEAWVGRNRGRILEARRQEVLSNSEEEESSGSNDQTPLSRSEARRTMTSGAESRFAILIMAFPPLQDTEEMADHVRENFKWHLRRASRPPHLLPEDYLDLCLSFALPNVVEAARDFELPEMV